MILIFREAVAFLKFIWIVVVRNRTYLPSCLMTASSKFSWCRSDASSKQSNQYFNNQMQTQTWTDFVPQMTEVPADFISAKTDMVAKDFTHWSIMNEAWIVQSKIKIREMRPAQVRFFLKTFWWPNFTRRTISDFGQIEQTSLPHVLLFLPSMRFWQLKSLLLWDV